MQEHPASQEAYITGSCWRSFFSKGSYFGASVRERGKTFQLLSLFFCMWIPFFFSLWFWMRILRFTYSVAHEGSASDLRWRKSLQQVLTKYLFHAGFRHLHNTSVAYEELAWYLRWRKFPSSLWSFYNMSKFSTLLLGFPGFPEGNLW